MRRVAALALAAALAGCGSPAPDAVADNGVVAMTLPDEPQVLPQTPAGELVTARCTACHSGEMITRQPPLDAKKWAATVAKMREAYKAPIAPGEDAGLVDALLRVQRGG